MACGSQAESCILGLLSLNSTHLKDQKRSKDVPKPTQGQEPTPPVTSKVLCRDGTHTRSLLFSEEDLEADPRKTQLQSPPIFYLEISVFRSVMHALHSEGQAFPPQGGHDGTPKPRRYSLDGWKSKRQRAVLLNLLSLFPGRHPCQGQTSHPLVTTRVLDRTHKRALKVNTGSTGQTHLQEVKGPREPLEAAGLTA